MSKGVLLVNLGSPDSPAVGHVRRFLREFLMDGRVLDVPWAVRFAIVHFAILPSRPKQSAHAYQSIWTPEGSPLIVISRRVQALLQERVSVPVALGMRYRNPSIVSALVELTRRGVDDLLLIPLFPHYAMSSYETAVERVRQAAAAVASSLRLRVQEPYGAAPEYITALVASAREHLQAGYDHLLFSFHGIPERHIRKADPTGNHCLQTPDCCDRAGPARATCYRAQCLETVAGFVKNAGVPAGTYSVSFQSRLGRDRWLGPYTDQELRRLGSASVKNLLVICPAFVSDCLETLEEIGMRGRDTFLSAGGGRFRQIPCLNGHPAWIDALEKMVNRFVGAG